ncbi:unnamed protein product, partial [marine sediment metagenome]
MKQVIASLISSDEVMPGGYLMWLDSPQIASTALPGQFIMVRCGEGSEYPLRRPLSIHLLSNNKLAILFTVSGKGT